MLSLLLMGLQVTGELADLNCAWLGGGASGLSLASCCKSQLSSVLPAFIPAGTQADRQCLPWEWSFQVTVEVQEGK